MPIHVEFYGLVRQRAGAAECEVACHAEGAALQHVCMEIARRHPTLEGVCVNEGQLSPGYIMSLNGKRFIKDEQEIIPNGETLLLLAADAGG